MPKLLTSSEQVVSRPFPIITRRRRRRSRSASSSSGYGGYVPRQRHRGKKGARASGTANGVSLSEPLGLAKPEDRAVDPAVSQAERQRRAQQWILEQQAASLNALHGDGAQEQAGGKLAREVYVGNLLVGVVNADSLRQFFDSSMAVAFPSDDPFQKPVIDVRMSQELNFAFVELRSEEMATAALQLSGTNLCGRPMVIARPSGYVDSKAVAQIAASKLAESEKEKQQPATDTDNALGPDQEGQAISEQTMDSSVVMLGNLVSETDLVGDAAYNDVCEDVMEECSRSGKVIELRIPRDLIDSTVKCNAFVKFASVAEAKAAVALFHGRKFDGRSVSAVLWPEEDFDKLPPNRAK